MVVFKKLIWISFKNALWHRMFWLWRKRTTNNVYFPSCLLMFRGLDSLFVYFAIWMKCFPIYFWILQRGIGFVLCYFFNINYIFSVIFYSQTGTEVHVHSVLPQFLVLPSCTIKFPFIIFILNSENNRRDIMN